MNLKNTFVAILVLILLVSAGCGKRTNDKDAGAEDKKKEKVSLVMLSYGGMWDEAIEEAYIKPFVEKYPHVEIILQPSIGVQILSQLVSTKNNPDVDLAFLDDVLMGQAVEEGVFEEIADDEVPGIDKLIPQAQEFGDYGVGYALAPVGIAYRTDKIDTPPTSWKELWEAKYKGRVAINNLENNAGMALLVGTALRNGGDAKNIDPGFERIKELIPNVLTATESTQTISQLLTTGEAWIAPWYDGRTYSLKSDGVPIDFAIPDEGIYGIVSYVNIVKETEHKDYALAFLEEATDPSNQAVFAELTGYAPTTPDYEVPEEMEGYITAGEEDLSKVILLDWEYISGQRSDWIDRWSREVD